MRILGIDPGYGRIGWGLIEGEKQQWQHVAHGCIETDPKAVLSSRLFALSGAIDGLIDTYAPSAAGIEELFFKKNVTTALKVAQARGVILLVLHERKIPIVELKPATVKQAVTGYGNATKSQIQTMITLLLGLKKQQIQDDAADALGVALATAAYILDVQ